ncbi:hypothetical protein GCM10018775_76970 [Streptomyces umbrinus]|nr:hypothetical protein GCM10018775_76970 [Streptomyces umbrinus]
MPGAMRATGGAPPNVQAYSPGSGRTVRIRGSLMVHSSVLPKGGGRRRSGTTSTTTAAIIQAATTESTYDTGAASPDTPPSGSSDGGVSRESRYGSRRLGRKNALRPVDNAATVDNFATHKGD